MYYLLCIFLHCVGTFTPPPSSTYITALVTHLISGMNKIWIAAKGLCHLLHTAFLGILKKYVLTLLRDNGGTFLLKRN